MMRAWWKKARRLPGSPWPVAADDEVDGEIAGHIELHTRHLIKQGTPPADARAQAIARFGDPERVRAELRDIRHAMETDMQRTEWFNDLRADVAFAARTFRRNPLFTLLLVLTIAVAVGSNATIFRVIDAVLLRPLPYRNAERTSVLWNGYQGGNAAVSVPEYFDMVERLAPSFADVAAVTPQPTALVVPGEDAERVSSYSVTPNLFRTLGVDAAIGRGLQPGDGAPGGERVAVISHALWRRRFGGEATVLGRSVNIGGLATTIVGVMPAGVNFPDAPIGFLRERADLWIANSFEHLRGDERGSQFLGVLGTRRSDASETRAQGDMTALERQFQSAFPDRYSPPNVPAWRLAAVPLREQMVGSVVPALAMLGGAVLLILLIACANVAGLLVARGAARRRELAVRLALGARRSRLVRQLLTESTVLGLSGGALGLGLAWVASRVAAGNAGGIPRLDDAGFGPMVVVFSIVASVVTGMLVGIAPAVQQSREELRGALGEGGRGSSDGTGRRLRRVLVGGQVAMAVVVLVAAGLLGKSLLALRDVDTGVRADGAYFLRVDPARARYDSAFKTLALYERLKDEMTQLPAGQSAAVYPLPMSGEGWGGSYAIPEPQVGSAELHAEYAVSTPDYFKVAGIAMLEGRDFTADDKRGNPPVIVIDEVLAQKHWPGASAVGKRLNPNRDPGQWATIVGVVRHVRNAGPRSDGEPQIYIPHAQHVQRPMALVVRTSMPETAVLAALRDALRRADPELPATRLGTMVSLVDEATARDRFYAVLLMIFAGTALLLASLGLYGVMASLVEQRKREIAIRVAVGGPPGTIRWLVMREGLAITLVGLVAGGLAAAATARVLTSLLFGITPGDPTTWGAIAMIVIAVTALASWAPLRRAVRVDPIDALRE
ncbi:MAG: ABC transporter permease [Cytophagaceae bacterium]|nr:ABC transporter permease [Gemmatimonadaceae bacterium]